MFQRRLKLFLAIMAAGCVALGLRAAQIQWLGHKAWQTEADKWMTQESFIQTTRGEILDRNGVVLAQDEPCIDACVDYRAITEETDPQWLRKQAIARLRKQWGDQWETVRGGSAKAIQSEIATMQDDLTAMWSELARVSGKSPDDIEEIRQQIVARVQMQRRYRWWSNYRHASADNDASAPWYRSFLGEDNQDRDDSGQYELDVDEQFQPHVILPSIDAQTQAELASQLDRFFALSFQPSKHRVYPYGRVACHVLGYLSPVTDKETGANDPFFKDKLRKYWPGDLIGRSGVEAMCEASLRGSRGQTETKSGASEPDDIKDPVPGQSVSLTIDVALQAEIEDAFARQRLFEKNPIRSNQHGAAIVIDVPSGQILALVSNPGYDPNQLDTQYAALSMDDLNTPLLNRATEMAVEPGSSIKTIVGCGAITDHVMSATDTIQCNGVLVIKGKPQAFGHCWTWAASQHAGVAPTHTAVDADCDLKSDRLTITDGLENSCNVVFGEVAYAMGLHRLCNWYSRFGLGRPVGIGIAENSGLLPTKMGTDEEEWGRACLMGIGGGWVHATPLQMANVAATIARNGLWVRPQIVDNESGQPTTRNASLGPDEVDLHISPEALNAVHLGMVRGCSEAGMAYGILPEHQVPRLDNDPLEHIQIAGKTGSAQTGHLLRIFQRDADGLVKIGPDKKPLYQDVPLGTPGTEGWYQSDSSFSAEDQPKHMAHAWFIGYAPAEHPRVAFAVLVEYGSAGGRVAGSIAHDILVSCVKHGYLADK